MLLSNIVILYGQVYRWEHSVSQTHISSVFYVVVFYLCKNLFWKIMEVSSSEALEQMWLDLDK